LLTKYFFAQYKKNQTSADIECAPNLILVQQAFDKNPLASCINPAAWQWTNKL